ALHLLRHPLVAGALYVGGLYAWHVPALYDAALADVRVHVLEHVWFLLTAFLFWSCVIDPAPFHATPRYPARLLYLLLPEAPPCSCPSYCCWPRAAARSRQAPRRDRN